MVAPAVELRSIEVFLVLAEELHFARTAERVGLTPSRVSQIIRRLEHEAGGALFERTSRRVRPTARGLLLQAELGTAHTMITDAFAAARRLRPSPAAAAARIDVKVETLPPDPDDLADPTRPVTMGVSGWSNEFQQRLISSLTISAAPRPVRVIPSNSTRSRVDGVAAGELDLAFVRLPAAPSEGLGYRALLTEPLLLAVPCGHRLAERPPEPAPVPLAALDGESLAFYERDQNPWWYDDVMSGLAAAGAQPCVSYRGLWHFDVLAQVSAGSVLALVTPTAAATARLEGVVYRRLSPAPTISQGLLWREDADVAPSRLVETILRSFL